MLIMKIICMVMVMDMKLLMCHANLEGDIVRIVLDMTGSKYF